MTFFDLTSIGGSSERDVDVDRFATSSKATVWTKRDIAASVACLVMTTVFVIIRYRIGGAVVPWDSKNHFYPMFRFLGDALRHGTIPLWNPYHFSGYPAVADPQSLVFTPSMMVFALIAPDASMQTFDAVIFLHIALGGVGVLGLARRWHWHPAAGVLAALVYMLGGAASSRLQHTGMIISYAWFPLAAWSLEAALDRVSIRLSLVAAAFTVLMALGRDQVAYHLCLALAGLAVWRIAQADQPLAYLRQRASVIAIAALATCTVMATPILLTMQFVHSSNRPGIAFGTALEGSLDPVNLMTLFAPNMFGSLDRLYDYWGPGAATAAGNDWTDRTIDYLFVGTVPIILILWHGLAGGRLFERRARYAALLIVLAGVYAFGRHTPIFGILYDWLPGVSLYRRPADATFALNVGLAFASGFLLQRFIEDGLPQFGTSLSFVRLAVTLLVSALTLGAALSFARDARHLDDSLVTALLASALAAIALVIAWVGRHPRYRAVAASLLVAATLGQLVSKNCVSAMNAQPVMDYGVFQTLSPDETKGLAALRADIAVEEAKGKQPRVEILGLDGPWQNAAMVLKLEDTVGYNPLRISTYERAVGVGESANDSSLRSFPDTFRGYNSRLAALLGLQYLVLDRRIDDLQRQIPRARATLLYGGKHLFIYRLDGPSVPRVYVASHAIAIDSDAIIDRGMIPSFDVEHEALVDAADMAKIEDPALQRDHSAAPAPHAQIVSYADDVVRIDVETAATGLLVLHDIAYPGWIATVDGRPTPVVRTNLIFRGAEVPAGHHVVEFRFHPLSLGNLMAAAEGLMKKSE